MYCFSIAVNCSTLDELSKIVCLFKLLYCSKMETDGMVTAYNSLVSMVNSFREDQLCFQDEAEQPDAVVDHDFNLPVHHPFGAYFSRKTDKVVLIDGGSTIIKYYKPEYFDALMKNWFPMAPFWSGLMLGKAHSTLRILNMTYIGVLL